MTDPVSSRLDTRFSNPGAVATGGDETLRALEQAELFWVTTVRSDGRPRTTPLVAVWSDGALHFNRVRLFWSDVTLARGRSLGVSAGGDEKAGRGWAASQVDGGGGDE
jgi:hypothetical protein